VDSKLNLKEMNMNDMNEVVEVLRTMLDKLDDYQEEQEELAKEFEENPLTDLEIYNGFDVVTTTVEELGAAVVSHNKLNLLVASELNRLSHMVADLQKEELYRRLQSGEFGEDSEFDW
jgi:cysteinyl-tRNA synthetase